MTRGGLQAASAGNTLLAAGGPYEPPFDYSWFLLALLLAAFIAMGARKVFRKKWSKRKE
jgi:hypothetical protein